LLIKLHATKNYISDAAELTITTVDLLAVSSKYVCLCADMMMSMGYSRKEIEESLFQQKYNDIMATYLLLARRGSDVSSFIVMPTKI